MRPAGVHSCSGTIFIPVTIQLLDMLSTDSEVRTSVTRYVTRHGARGKNRSILETVMGSAVAIHQYIRMFQQL